MARTLNPEAHAGRRDAFVDAAQRIIQTKGYGQLSVQAVLDETKASKGAFYHYFDSKEGLMEAVIDRIVDAALTTAEPVALDPTMSPIDQLGGLFHAIAGWKNARRELMLALIPVWLSNDNIVVREKARGQLVTRIGPLIAQIIARGEAQGVFSVGDPAVMANVILNVIWSWTEPISRIFLDCQDGKATAADAERTIDVFEQAIERMLRAPAGSVKLVEDATIQMWFTEPVMGKEIQ